MKIGNITRKLKQLMKRLSPKWVRNKETTRINWEDVISQNRLSLAKAIDVFNNRPYKTAIDLKLPPHSRCVDMAVANNCILAIFDIPSRGLIPFVINPNKNEVHEVQLTPDEIA